MTKKDYELFAMHLKNARKHELKSLTDAQFESVVEVIAAIFGCDNRTFSMYKFVKACGVE